MDINNNEIRLNYAWKWFKYHAQQRTTTFNYFLIISGALFAGFVQTIEKHPTISAVICIIGAIISYAFVLLDIRNEELVNCGRNALNEYENCYGIKIRSEDENRSNFSEANKGEIVAQIISKDMIKHRVIFRNIEKLVVFVFLCAFLYTFTVKIKLLIVISHYILVLLQLK